MQRCIKASTAGCTMYSLSSSFVCRTMTPAKIALVLLIVSVFVLVEGRPTHCERWKGDSEFRCGKDNYRLDYVTVRSRGQSVSFRIGKWNSHCGKPGLNYSDQTHTLTPNAATNIEFPEAGAGVCGELFVYQCKINGKSVNCLDAVLVTPHV